MRRLIVLLLVFFLIGNLSAAQAAEQQQTGYAEKAPFSIRAPIFSTEAIWDLQLSFDMQIATGDLGNAGAEFDGTYYYSTRWASNLLHKYDMTGALVEEFSITGVSGLRDLAFDGTYMYGGAAANTIYIMDFVSKTLIGTITSPIPVRSIAYDNANDGFWVANWDTDLILVSRTGATLATIPATTHLLGSMYGSAYDDWSDGGPYLWIFDQGPAGDAAVVNQLSLTSGTLTGISHDVGLDFPASLGIAGGLFTATGIVPGKVSIGGVLQGTPDMFFVYELALAADPDDPNPPSNVVAYSDYTTPTSMLITWTDPTTLVNGTAIAPTDFTIEIERDGVFLTSVPGGTANYTDTGLTDGTLYEYTLITELNANDSTSTPVIVSWYAGGSPIPSPPANLTVVGGTTDAVLNWDDPTTQTDGTPLDDLDSIYVYRDGQKIAAVDAGVETYTDVPPVGFFYNYTVVAKDNETPVHLSAPSNTAGTFVGSNPDFLVWVGPGALAASAVSGDSIFNSLVANGESAFLTNNLFEFGTDLSIFEGIFVVLGIFSNNHVISASDPEGPALETYLQNGGRIYLEGGDCFNYDPGAGGYNIQPWFGLNPGPDGSGDVFGVIGLNDLSAFQFAYNGENAYMDQLQPATSTPVWQNDANTNICGVFNAGYGLGRTIGVVPSFGGFVSSAEALNTNPRVAANTGTYTDFEMAVKVPGVRNNHSEFVKKAAYYPELKKDRPVIDKLLKLTPGGIYIEANTQDDLMAAYVALFRLLPTPPAISLSHTSYVDTLLIGATLNNILTVRNSGGSLADILNFTIAENPAVSWLDVTPTSGSLSANQSADITLALDASGLTAGTYNTSLEITSNDPANPLLTVSITLVANDAPLVSVSPDSFHFDLLTGGIDSAQFTISNLGAGPLTFELSDQDILNENSTVKMVDRSYIRPEYNVEIPKGQPDWRVGTPQTEGSGGPDLYGYTWIDSDEPGGPVFNWIDISTTGTEIIGLSDDNHVGPFPIGFTFNFYGNEYTEFYVQSNGTVNFENTYISLGNAQIPVVDDYNNLIAWLWDDLDPGNPLTHVYYQTIGNMMVIQFAHYFEYPDGGAWVDAEMILYNNGNIKIQYDYFEPGFNTLECTVGIENIDGTDGLQVAYNGAYLHDDLALLFSLESQWLSENPTSGTIPPGGSTDIQVIADAAGMLGGDYLATVLVNSNDPVNPVVELPRVSLTVTGVPVISTTPASLTFDSTFVGLAPTQEMLVANAGTDQLIISDIISTNPVFTVDTSQFNLAPFSNLPVTVTFAPLLPGNYAGWLIVSSNDAVNPLDSTFVTGTGIEAPVALVNPTFQNPVFVGMNDSLEIFINISNAGGSNLLWSAQASSAPVSGEKITRPAKGPTELSEAAENHVSSKSSTGINIEAIWDLQLSFDMQIATGDLGNAGAEFDGTYYYSTRWASNLLHKYDMTGALLEEFSIPGVTGLRDLAFDGTYMYGGAAANTIYMMDFVSKTLIGTITSPIAVRSIAYDNANDGFWVANWETDLVLISRTGVTLSMIPAGTHTLGSMYGTAYDNWSDGGPYLWVFDQGPSGDAATIHQLSLTTGTLTGISHNVAADFPTTSGVAGALFTAEGIVPGKASIGGVLQGTPDMFFVYELAQSAPDWIKVLATAGTISPMDQFDIPVRIKGNATPGDTAYVIIHTNDPALPVMSVEVIRTMVTGIEGQTALPTTFDVSQNYPNPFNPTTSIKYQLPRGSEVKLMIYNVLGQKVRTLVNSPIEAGYHAVIWDGRNDEGNSVSSGVYIYRFEAGNFISTMKLMLLK